MSSTLRRLLGASLLAVIIIGTACSDNAPTAAPAAAPVPEATVSDDLLGGLVGGLLKPVTGLLSCDVSQTRTASKVVGSQGGYITVGAHALVIPPGALSGNVTISAVAPAGNRVAVDFAPHGLRFARPTVLSMSYAECGLVKGLLLRIVYVDDSERILQILPSLQNLRQRRVVGTTDHFSKYMLAY